MKKIIILARSRELESYFAPLRLNLTDQEVDLVMLPLGESDKNFFDQLLEEKGDLLLIEYAWLQKKSFLLEEIIEKLESNILIVAHFEDMDKELLHFRKLCDSHHLIKGAIDTSQKIQFFYPLIRSSFEKRSHDESFEEIFDLAQGNFKKAKKLHRKLIPIRLDVIKPFSFMSKFIVGTESGGDFFDIFSLGSCLVLFFTRTSSYADMVSVLTHMEELRKKKRFDSPTLENFIHTLSDEFKIPEMKEERGFEYLLTQVDLRSLAFEAYHFGNIRLFSNRFKVSVDEHYLGEKNFCKQAFFKGKLDRGEKWIVLSPGLSQNLPQGIQGKPVEEYLFDEIESPAQDLVDEICFQIKKRTKGVFPRYNASFLLFEVDANAITIV